MLCTKSRLTAASRSSMRVSMKRDSSSPIARLNRPIASAPAIANSRTRLSSRPAAEVERAVGSAMPTIVANTGPRRAVGGRGGGAAGPGRRGTAGPRGLRRAGAAPPRGPWPLSGRGRWP